MRILYKLSDDNKFSTEGRVYGAVCYLCIPITLISRFVISLSNNYLLSVDHDVPRILYT